jgi:hypothetical protein
MSGAQSDSRLPELVLSIFLQVEYYHHCDVDTDSNFLGFFRMIYSDNNIESCHLDFCCCRRYIY